MTPEDIDKRFTYQPPLTDEHVLAHQVVRGSAREYAVVLNDLLPEGREKSLAITHLEEVVFWSNAALARERA